MKSGMQNSECRCRHCRPEHHSTLCVHNNGRKDSDKLVRLALQFLELSYWRKFECGPDSKPVEAFTRLAKRDLQVSDELPPRGTCLGLLEVRTYRRAGLQQLIDKRANTWPGGERQGKLRDRAAKSKRPFTNVTRRISSHARVQCMRCAGEERVVFLSIPESPCRERSRLFQILRSEVTV
jgi:hypothetical protein